MKNRTSKFVTAEESSASKDLVFDVNDFLVRSTQEEESTFKYSFGDYMYTLDSIYKQIGRQYVLNYVAIGSGIGRLKPKNCKKGWECGYTCLPKTKKNCKSAMT